MGTPPSEDTGRLGDREPGTPLGPGATSWHARPTAEALQALGTSPEGLHPAEAARRLARYGPNRLRRVEPVSALRILAAQLASLVVALLMAAAGVALLLGDVLEAVAIGAVLFINTAIGFGVELRARRAMDALLRFDVPLAKVVRGGVAETVSSDVLVPGDVVLVEEGDTIPADARLLSASELRVDEAPLTGESIAVDKDEAPVADPEAVLAERDSMLYSGTTIVRGRGTGVVVATGPESEVGRIGTLVAQVEASRTPLEERLDALGRRLVFLTLGTATVVIGLGILRGQPIGRMVETGLALAIAAVPEGLPAVATIALAVGLRRMARRQALVRRLVAVEALGATTVVCTDKTGTLTAGRMTATAVASADRTVSVTGEGYAPDGDFRADGAPLDPAAEPWLRELLEACALTSRARLDPEGGADPLGDPTDAALLVLARKGGVDADALRETRPQIDEAPFTSKRRYSTSVHREGSGQVTFVKGSPEALLASATHVASAAGPVPLTPEVRARVGQHNEELARRGLRVIALAKGPGTDALTLLGLVGIVDPPAPGVRETVQALREAGVRTVMVTGDQARTARAIAEELGSVGPDDEDLDGRALSRLTDDELAGAVGGVGVFSRVTPEQKLRVVDALQRRGEIVAMIGDGVNDAAALKKADIGVAMGRRGTDVAKQTASIVLGDDRFSTIRAAVEEGRVIYENIRKFVFYLFSCNLAEVLVLLCATLIGTPVPLLPLQILWLNLVTDTFPALALALEPAEPDVMRRPPRDPDEAILSRRFLSAMGFHAALITAVTLAAYLWGLQAGDPTRASTIAFMTLALAQLFHLGNARSRRPVLGPARALANRWAVAAVPLVLALQVLAVHWAPLARVLGTVPLDPVAWAWVTGLALLPAVAGQAVEVIQERRPRPATDPPAA